MAKHKKHNPERRSWKGRSYKKSGKRVRALREAVTEADEEDLDSIRFRRMVDIRLQDFRQWIEALAHWANSHNCGSARARRMFNELLKADPSVRINRSQALQGVANELQRLGLRIFDESLCNNDCKMLYFCTKKKGHSGGHRDEFGLKWNDDD